MNIREAPIFNKRVKRTEGGAASHDQCQSPVRILASEMCWPANAVGDAAWKAMRQDGIERVVGAAALREAIAVAARSWCGPA